MASPSMNQGKICQIAKNNGDDELENAQNYLLNCPKSNQKQCALATKLCMMILLYIKMLETNSLIVIAIYCSSTLHDASKTERLVCISHISQY